MSDGVIASTFGNLLQELETTLTSSWDWPSPEAAFAGYVYYRAGEKSPCTPLPSLTWPLETRLVHAPDLASVGYLLHAGGGLNMRAAWRDAVSRIQASNLFVDRQSFAYRPIELFGIISGVAAFGTESQELMKWGKDLLSRTSPIHGQEGWPGLLQVAAEIVVGVRNASPVFDVSGWAAEDIAMSSWICRAIGGSKPERAIDESLLKTCGAYASQQMGIAKAAVMHCSVRDAVNRLIESEISMHWQLNRPRRDAEALVVTVCRRFHLFAEQLKSRHDQRPTVEVKDEYDVQNLMHALLKIHFEDVRAEEVTPSVAGKAGRMDFLLKRERLVVETKMTRKNLDQKKVGDELMVDMTRYKAHPEYRTLVCFVYDPEGYCHNPTALEDDLTKTDGDYRTVVIVCPKGI